MTIRHVESLEKIMIEIKLANPNEQLSQQLMAELTAELEGRYDGSAEVDVTRMPELHNVTGDDTQFVIAWLDGEAVGCGAIRPIDAQATEVKRMYIRPFARGKGISRKILAKLESLAATGGFSHTRLETGLNQPEAIKLYETSGYTRIPCYGVYAQNPESVCYEKTL